MQKRHWIAPGEFAGAAAAYARRRAMDHAGSVIFWHPSMTTTAGCLSHIARIIAIISCCVASPSTDFAWSGATSTAAAAAAS